MDGGVSFIAEVSSNHNQDLNRCRDFIDAATDAGCDAVKFQLFKIDQLFSPQVLAQSAEHRRRAQWELPKAFLAPLAEHCATRGVDFLCTPFYLEAVHLLEPYVSAYKIASYELLWADLLKACAETGKPIILSTGMATLDEVKAAVTTLKESGCADPTLLHCVSAYPTPVVEANLAAIETLRGATGCTIGWSDHTVSPAVIYRAVHRFGASVVELHLDLDGKGAEYQAGHCWLPKDLAPVIANIRDGLTADGLGIKSPTATEATDREWRADPSDGLRPLKHVRDDL